MGELHGVLGIAFVALQNLAGLLRILDLRVRRQPPPPHLVVYAVHTSPLFGQCCDLKHPCTSHLDQR
jgi:hypothetical protein